MSDVHSGLEVTQKDKEKGNSRETSKSHRRKIKWGTNRGHLHLGREAEKGAGVSDSQPQDAARLTQGR